jgi:uncharacterized protein involved in exopolysaccharide biosynthesis
MKATETLGSKDINLLDFLIIILKKKRMILGITLSLVFITTVVSFLMTPIYRAETTIFPPHQKSSGIAIQLLSEFTTGAQNLLGGDLGLSNPNDTYTGMLKSRTVYDRIIDRFNLMEYYEEEFREDARKQLDDSVKVKDNTGGIIVIQVEDADPQLAANMANGFVEELKEMVQVIAVTEASKRRLFFDGQLKQSQENLVRAEEAMRDFQESTGVIKIEDQTEAVIESIASLRAIIAAKEVELKVMKTFATQMNPDLQRIQEELSGMKEQLNKLETSEGSSGDPIMPTAVMPAMGTDYIRKLRNLKYHEHLYELMAKQYEVARVDEARDATVIQILDKAVPPEKEAKPKKALMVSVSMFTGLFFSLFVAFCHEYILNLKNDAANGGKLNDVKKYSKFMS